MGSQQTLDVLQSYASVLNDAGDARGAESVSALAAALSAAEDAKVKATVTKVAKLWAMSPEVGMSPVGLDVRLRALHRLLAVGGGKAASADIKLLAELLESRQAGEPPEFERVLRDTILAPLPPKAAKPKVPKRVPLSACEMRQWADRLTAVTADQSAFETELSVLMAIPKLSVPELRAVAEHYLGHPIPGSKAKILKALRARQKQDAIEAARQGRLSRIAV